ncbi:outer membrane protein transport protein [Paraperlucidibaca sp.]|uniref:OmpP1/FadL family transporter n=1 Tax=Paraperlucidibaca sp. TaxID=2708021 RepID=UPI0030F3E490
MPVLHPALPLRALSLSIFALALSAGAQAGGLDLPTITAAHQGTANANGAEASDPSVIYYNPAGLARMKGGLQISQGFSALFLRGKAEANVAETRHGAGTDQTSGQGDSVADDNPGPAGSFWPKVLGAGGAFVSLPINDTITAGIGVFAPGGGNLNYKSDWAGKYQIDSIAIELININPSIGIRFDDMHSVGFGVSVIGGHIRQKSAIDVPGVVPYLLRGAIESGTLDVLTLDPTGGVLQTVFDTACNGALSGIGPVSSLCGTVLDTLGGQLAASDASGSAQVEMYGYGLGYNLGYMFAPTDRTRFGIAYRSESKVKLRGDIEWDLSNIRGSALTNLLIDTPLVSGQNLEDYLRENLRPDTTAKSDLIIPARTSVNVFHQLTDKIDILADFTFIETSAVDKIRVQFLDQTDPNGNPIKQGDAGIDTKWRDSFKVSVGGNYHWDDQLTLRSGFQFDKTPIPSAEFRHPGAPDSDRFMYAIGANYKVNRKLSIDAAYSVTFLEDSLSNYTERCRTLTRDDENGNYDPDGESCTANGGKYQGRFFDTSIQVLSLQLNQKF